MHKTILEEEKDILTGFTGGSAFSLKNVDTDGTRSKKVADLRVEEDERSLGFFIRERVLNKDEDEAD